jgi:hypothetical protein
MMATTKQYECFRCKQPILFGADKTKLNTDGNIHHCHRTSPLAETGIETKIIDIEQTPTTPPTTATTKQIMHDSENKTFLQNVVRKYEQNRQTEQQRRGEMLRMHNENIAAWNAMTNAINRLAAAIEGKEDSRRNG